MHDEFGFSPKPWEERYQLSMRQHSTGLLFRLEQIREGGRKPVAALLELLTSNAGKRELVVVEVVAQGSNHLLKNTFFCQTEHICDIGAVCSYHLLVDIQVLIG